MTSPAVSNATYVILGASGNTGSVVADFLFAKGEKVRVVGRDTGRLQRFVDNGAEAFRRRIVTLVEQCLECFEDGCLIPLW